MGPGDLVLLDDEQWEIEAVANNVFSLRNTATGAMQNMSLAAISRRMNVPPLFDRSLAETGKLMMADAIKGERERLETWTSRIQEIVDGKPHGADRYRLGYDPEQTNQTDRLMLMLKQLNDAGIKVGKRTLERYVSEFKKAGAAGLLDKRTTRKHHPLDGIAEEVLGCVDEMIADRRYKSSTPYTVQATTVTLMVKEQFPDRTFIIPKPDRLKAAIKEKTKGRDPAGPAKRRRTASNVPDWMFNGMAAIMPGSEVQIDSSRYDVRARKPDGAPGSFTLTVMIDKATRSVLASSVQETGQGAAHAYLLAQALTPAEARPGSEELFNPWVLKGKHLPWAGLLDTQMAAKWETRRPVIRIFRILTDNGKDYTSRVFEAACRQLGVVITRAAPGSPTDKPIVERFFDTLLDQFIPYLPGNTGGDTSRRGEDPDSEDLLGIEDLTILLDRWITQVWQNQPLEGLRDPLNPSAKPVSPNVMYASMFPFVGHIPLALTEEDYISLLPVESRTIQMDGIQFQRRQYDSEDLALFRMTTSGDGKLDGWWEIHYRPTDPRQVWVYVPKEDRYITCYLKESRFDNPHLEAYRRIAREMSNSGYVIPDNEAAEVSAGFIKKEIARIRREEKQKARNELAEHLAEVQGMGGPATRTDLTSASLQDSEDDIDWNAVEEYHMEAFNIVRDTDDGEAG
jgi:transposase InsO family protein